MSKQVSISNFSKLGASTRKRKLRNPNFFYKNTQKIFMEMFLRHLIKFGLKWSSNIKEGIDINLDNWNIWEFLHLISLILVKKKKIKKIFEGYTYETRFMFLVRPSRISEKLWTHVLRRRIFYLEKQCILNRA